MGSDWQVNEQDTGPRHALHSSISVWFSAVYAAGLMVWTGVLIASDRPGLLPIGTASCTVLGVYLLDRHRTSDRQTEPGAAMPSRTFRSLSYGFLACAGVLAWVIEPWAILLPIAAVVSVLAYGGKSTGSGVGRLKDITLLKNTMVTVCYVVLCAGLVWFETQQHSVFIALALGFTILGDAIGSDADDAQVDRARNTRTIPVVFGRTRALALALIFHLLACGTLVLKGPEAMPLALAIFLPASGAFLLLLGIVMKRLPLRAAIDLRPAAILIWVML